MGELPRVRRIGDHDAELNALRARVAELEADSQCGGGCDRLREKVALIVLELETRAASDRGLAQRLRGAVQ